MNFQELREEILDRANMKEVAEALNIPMKNIGGRINILSPLPEHNDTNFGSCVLKDTFGYDFAFNKSFNAIDLVMYTKDCSFWEAVLFLADLYEIDVEIDEEGPVTEPLILRESVLSAAQIDDIQGLRQLYGENRDMFFRYLKMKIRYSLNRLKSLRTSETCPEITSKIDERITMLERTEGMLKEHIDTPQTPLKILTNN